MRRLVDLPAPFGPRKATSSPRWTSRSRSVTASTVFFLTANCLVKPRAVMMVVGHASDGMRHSGQIRSAIRSRMIRMSDTTTTSRVLSLLNLLQTHRHWAGPELAERLGVTDRTLRRDVERLRDLGYRVESVPGTGGGYRLEAGARAAAAAAHRRRGGHHGDRAARRGDPGSRRRDRTPRSPRSRSSSRCCPRRCGSGSTRSPPRCSRSRRTSRRSHPSCSASSRSPAAITSASASPTPRPTAR